MGSINVIVFDKNLILKEAFVFVGYNQQKMFCQYGFLNL